MIVVIAIILPVLSTPLSHHHGCCRHPTAFARQQCRMAAIAAGTHHCHHLNSHTTTNQQPSSAYFFEALAALHTIRLEKYAEEHYGFGHLFSRTKHKNLKKYATDYTFVLPSCVFGCKEVGGCKEMRKYNCSLPYLSKHWKRKMRRLFFLFSFSFHSYFLTSRVLQLILWSCKSHL